ncbi:RHS repeat domain-containing protein, partial [Chromobacterium violaceum]|uniref:RHS repeat domain-containing protein n=2 Tax=Chromobacterium violaceum TaxID=536 RepID=UPI0020CACE28
MTDTIRYAQAIALDGLAQALQAGDLAARLKPGSQDQATRTVYDAAGRQRYVVNAAGAVTQYEYDAAGNVTTKREYSKLLPAVGVKLQNADGSWHAMGHKLGAFAAGDVVTASVRFKAPAGWSGELYVGNADSAVSDLTSVQSLQGNGDWQTLVLPGLMLKHADNLKVYLYNRTASTDPNAGVVYAGLRVSSQQRGQVFSDDFNGLDVGPSGWDVSAGTSPTTSRLPASDDAEGWLALQSALQNQADQVTRYAYDTAGRRTFTAAPGGAVTQYEYDAAGNVTTKREYSKLLPAVGVKLQNADGSWHAMGHKLGAFAAGDVVTASVRFKAPAGWSGELYVGNADSAVSDLTSVQSLQGNGDWQTLVLPGLMLKHADNLKVYLYNRTASTDPNAGVVYAGLRVSSQQRGQVFSDDFNGLDVGPSGWDVSAGTSPTTSRLPASDDAEGWLALQSALQNQADRVTRYVYDAAGRLLSVSQGDGITQAQTVRYELDAYGNRIKEWDGNNHLTSREFDALGRVHKETHGEGDATVTDYDAFGNAVKITDPRGNAGYFYFDALGRRILQVDPEGGATRTDYDAFGNARAVTRYANAVDPATLQIGTPPAIVADAGRDAVTRIEHDALGRQTRITDAEGG